jgi:CDP-glucose 4,6-dehydratase
MVDMFNLLKNTYQGKKIFLTGHTGFKGSWLLRILNLLGAQVKGYALSPESGHNLYNVLNSDCESVINDIRNREAVIEAITIFKPDLVFHLAAQPLVRLSYQTPSETFAVNAVGTANVLDGINALENACYGVMITTDKVYHNYEWHHPYRESDRLGGYDPYSASKACAELIIDSYRSSFFNSSIFDEHNKAIAVGRAGNVIGGGDWSKDRLVPDIVRALANNQSVEIRNPNSVRPWQHVLEPLIGYLILGARLQQSPQIYSQAYNFGPNFNDALPVKEMLKMAIESWGGGNYELINNENQPHEAGLLKLDISKAMAELNWHPKMNADKAIKITIDWYKQFYNKSDMLAFTNGQIIEFLNG